MAALTVWTSTDGLLSWLAPLGLAAAAGTALLVDLDPEGPAWGGAFTLADLVRRGPRRADLVPQKEGMAVLANGGITQAEAAEVVEGLLEGWPAVVCRSPAEHGRFAPVVPVYPLLPGSLGPPVDRFSVYQHTGYPAPRSGEGILIPRPSAATVRRLLEGQLPNRRCRWGRAWQRVWDHSWT